MEHELHVQLGRITREIEDLELGRLLDKAGQDPGGLTAAEKQRLKELLARRADAGK